ncbi:unnamed protein product, partial [Polarella glacialis]
FTMPSPLSSPVGSTRQEQPSFKPEEEKMPSMAELVEQVAQMRKQNEQVEKRLLKNESEVQSFRSAS